MAIRRLNYTGRVRINREDVRINLANVDTDFPGFIASIDLTKYKFPTDAKVYVEAYRQTSWMRWNFGTVQRSQHPEDTSLASFSRPDGILFRVKVVGENNHAGVLLGVADQVSAVDTNAGEVDESSLLPATGDKSLGQRAWVLDVDPPLLRVNAALGDWRAVVRMPIFQSLVLPAVANEILVKILLVDEFDELSDGNWRAEWLRFFCRIPGVAQIPERRDEEEDRDWIGNTIAKFALSKSLLTGIETYVEGEDKN